MDTNLFLMMSGLNGEEQNKFENWLNQYEAVLAVDSFFEDNAELLKTDGAKENIEELKVLAKSSDNIPVEPGQIRLLKEGLTTDPHENTCVLVLSQWSGNRWLVAPFSPYTVPATQGEMSTGIDFHAYQVVEAWNTVVVPDFFLQMQSNYLRDVDETVRRDACIVFFQKLEGKEMPEELKPRTGAKIQSKLDPRIQYLLNEQLLLEPLRDKIGIAEEFLRNMEPFESAPWTHKNDSALAASDKTESVFYLSVAEHQERIKVFRVGNEIRFEFYSADFNDYSNMFDTWYIVSEEGCGLGEIKGNRCRVTGEISIESICLADSDGKLVSLSPAKGVRCNMMFSLPQISGIIAEKYPENLIFCDSETLLSVAEESWNSITCRANCLAELLIRLYLNREETVQIEDRKALLRNQVAGILSHGEVSAFLLYSVMPLKALKPNKTKRLELWSVKDADDLSRSSRAALRERLRTFFRTDGMIPVQCGDNKGWMIPFDLEKGESRYAVSDMDGNVIDEWNDAVSQMSIAPYSVRVHCYATQMSNNPSSFIGRSLMLPVWAAIQKKEGILPDYNPFKIILSGAFDQNGILSKVDINGKAAELAEHYPDAILLIPESCDLSGLNVKSANIHMLPNDLMEDLIPSIKQEVEQSQELTLDYAFRKIPSLCDDVQYKYYCEWKEIIRILEATAKFDEDDNPLEYLLNLSLQREAYSHIGNTKKALELYEKAYAFATEHGGECSCARLFVGRDNIEFDAIRDRIRQAVTGGVGGQNQSFCSIGRPISKSFVGRLEELKKLNKLVFKNDGNGGNTLMQIPVITGDAGVGKTELAIAFACVYADKFPQGRFLIPMQGVTSWADAMTKLVECCDNCGQNSVDILGLPEDFNKLPSEEKWTAVYRMLSKRAQKGALLLLLDNLENMRLISENDGLRELPGTVPANLHMIATTRINEASSSSLEVPTPFEIDNLKEKDALELFCKICDKVFPFADFPFEDGKLSIDLIPEEKRPGPEKIESLERDYGVLRDIIGLLNRHAWSVEIVAGRIAFKSKRMKIDIRKEWAGLRDNLLGNLKGKPYRSDGNKPESLLQQTFDLILKQDELVEGLGQKIMRLAEIASFFLPDQIPEYALKQIWIEQFGDEEISFEQDGMSLTVNAYEYAVNQLNMFRITGGKEPMFKMHRLTREVLLNRFSEEEKLGIVGLMRKCLDDILKSNSNLTLQFLQPWCAWGNEWIDALPVLQEDTTFLKTLLDLATLLNNDAIQNLTNHSFLEAEKGFSEAIKIYRRQPSNSLGYTCIGTTMANLAVQYKACSRYKEAEANLKEALSFFHNLMEEKPEKNTSYYAHMLISLASLYEDTQRFQEAEHEYSEALAIFQKLAENNLEKHSGNLAEILRRLADFHSDRLHFDEAEKEYKECLEIYRNLMQEKPEVYSYDFACTLNNSAKLHSELGKFEVAENEYSEALSIFRKLAANNPQMHKKTLVTFLSGYASFLSKNRSNYIDALSRLKEALTILRGLAGANPSLYDSNVASCLCDIGFVYCRLKEYPTALSILSEALEIYRNLSASNSQYKNHIANTLCHLAEIHVICGQVSSAYSEYKEALDIFREIALLLPDRLDSTIAMVLGELGELYLSNRKLNEAECALSEALAICRNLDKKNPGAFSLDIALCLERLIDYYRLTECREKVKSTISELMDIYKKEEQRIKKDMSEKELQHKMNIMQRLQIRKNKKN